MMRDSIYANSYKLEIEKKNKDKIGDIRVEITTNDFSIVGDIFIPNGFRLSDFMNETTKAFIPITNVYVVNTGNEKDLLIIRKDSINTINPVQ